MAAFTGVLFSIAFCAVGSIQADNKCEDGSTPTQTELHIITADECTVGAELFPKGCIIRNLIEVKRNGETIATMPADILTEKERYWLMQNVAGAFRR